MKDKITKDQEQTFQDQVEILKHGIACLEQEKKIEFTGIDKRYLMKEVNVYQTYKDIGEFVDDWYAYSDCPNSSISLKELSND